MTCLRLFLAVTLAFLLADPCRAQDDPLRTAKEVLKRKAEIQKKLEAYRGLKFKKDVRAEIQSDEEFRAFCKGSLDEELPEEKARAYSRALQALGLLPEGFDIREELVEMMSTQAGAYYDPEKKTFYLLKTDFPMKKLEPIVLHELMHALQDQYFDLGEAMKAIVEADHEDGGTAFKFLVEGEAQYLGALHELNLSGQLPMSLDDLPEAARDMILEPFYKMQADIHRTQMKAMLDMAAAMGEVTETEKKAFAQQVAMPAYLYHSLADPYAKGAYMIKKVHTQGGWKAVEKLFENPPTSTEQCIHPEKLIGKRDEPVYIDIANDLVGGEELWENTLGELGLNALFEELFPEILPTEPLNPLAAMMGGGVPETRGQKASAGWDGDRFRVVDRDGTIVVLGITTWDTENDAKEFLEFYKEALARKLKGKKDRHYAVERRGKDVAVVEGARQKETPKLLDAIFASKRADTLDGLGLTKKSPEKPAEEPKLQEF